MKSFEREKVTRDCKLEVYYDFWVPIFFFFVHIGLKHTLNVEHIKGTTVTFKIINMGRLTRYYYCYRLVYPDKTVGPYRDIKTDYPTDNRPDNYVKTCKGDSLTFTMECTDVPVEA